MTSTAFGLLLALAQASIGTGGHHAIRSGACDACGRPVEFVWAEIQRLQTCPNWKARDDAAHDLRQVNWRCHPEAVSALATALLCDRHEEVREEAAESLAKMRPCLAEVHIALDRAARCDPDHATRKWARRGLKALGRHCVDACTVCGPAPVVAPRPALSIEINVPGPRFAPPVVVEPPLAQPAPVEPPLPPPDSPDPRLAPLDPVEPPLSPDLPSPLPPPAPRPPAGSSPFVAPPADEPPLDVPLTQQPRRRPLTALIPFGRRPAR